MFRLGGLGRLALIAVGLSHLNYAQINAYPAVNGAQLDAVASRLWARTNELMIWDLSIPSLAVHEFIACGESCYDDLLDKLAFLFISPLDVEALHEGQLTKLFADAKRPLDTSIIFRNFDIVSVGELLMREEGRLIESLNRRVQTESEVDDGQYFDYGWTFANLCVYYGGGNYLPLLVQYIDSGIVRHLESGSHELEGLAHCYAEMTKVDRGANGYTMLQSFLHGEIDAILADMRDDGQVYEGASEGWFVCNELEFECEVLQDLSKQAHFLEWVLILQDQVIHHGVERALARFDELVNEVLDKVDKSWMESNPLNRFKYAGAASHALRVYRKRGFM